MNILVIEDDHLLKRAIGHYLLDIGHMVSSCSNGQEAIDIIKNNRNFDVLIVDVLMPVLSGASFLLMVRKYFPQGMPYIIVVSAVKKGEEFVKQLDVPYDHYIQKPLDFEDLGELINSLERQRAGQHSH
jgi:DNA-binding response OmpR family regulator